MARILVVDDNEQVAVLVKDVLETSTRHGVVYVTSPIEACRQITTSEFDLVLMDLLLHDQFDGILVMAAMRGFGYRGPAIAVTGNLLNADEGLYEGAGFSAKILKPFNIAELVAEVNRQLNGGAAAPQSGRLD